MMLKRHFISSGGPGKKWHLKGLRRRGGTSWSGQGRRVTQAEGRAQARRGLGQLGSSVGGVVEIDQTNKLDPLWGAWPVCQGLGTFLCSELFRRMTWSDLGFRNATLAMIHNQNGVLSDPRPSHVQSPCLHGFPPNHWPWVVAPNCFMARLQASGRALCLSNSWVLVSALDIGSSRKFS